MPNASSPNSANRRVAVTGIGALSGLGQDQRQLWQGLREGRCGIGEVTLFNVTPHRTQIGAQVPNFRALDHFSRRETQRLSRCDQLALVAAREALEEAGLLQLLKAHDVDTERMGVVFGAGAGGSLSAEHFYRDFKQNGLQAARPRLLCSYAPGAATDAVASRFGLTGARTSIVTACSSSNTAIGYAGDLITRGECDVVVTGGADALSELTYTGFNALKAVSPSPCRPFDRQRDGLSLGEAAGVLIFEAWEHAQNRQARILAEFLGYGLSSDAYHMTAPEPDGLGAERAMRSALDACGLRPEQIDYVSAHATATPHNDPAEAKAMLRVFGSQDGRCAVTTSAVKSMLGHCLGAAGAIEAVALVLTILNDCIPPTIHHDQTDPECPVDCVPNTARQQTVRRAMSNSFAFGGNNCAVVFAKGRT